MTRIDDHGAAPAIPGDVGDSLLLALAPASRRVLVDMATDTPVLVSLRGLCAEAGRALDAAEMSLVLGPEVAVGHPPIRFLRGAGGPVAPSGQVSSGQCGEPSDGVWVVHDLDIQSADGGDLGRLHVVWDGECSPGPDVAAAVQGVAMLARVVIERHLTQRQRVVMIARERDRIAGLLHDDPIQGMTAVSLQLQRLVGRLPEGEEREAASVARRSTDAAIERLRHMLFSLHPTTLEEEGLEAALEVYCEAYVETVGIQWAVHSTLGLTDIPFGVAALAFRLARGAIENAVKHAQASTLWIDLMADQAMLDITVGDDGTGFDPDATAPANPGHLGLAHARYLVSLVGGRYDIDSAPGSGTRVHIGLSLL